MTEIDYASDHSFGPQFNDKFDFTLDFEHSILTTVPATLLIAATPIYFFLYKGREAVIRTGQLLLAKIAVAVLLIGFECAALALWSSLRYRGTEQAVAAASLSLVAALCLLPILYLEHQHSLRSTAYLGLWLVVTILCDIAKTRSLFLREDLHTLGILTTLLTVLRTILLALGEVSKKSLIKDEQTRENAGYEATSGFLSRTLFLWMYRLFSHGFKNIMTLDDLDKLDPTFAAHYLIEQLAIYWRTYSGQVQSSLTIACFRVSLLPFIANIFPQLCYSAFTVCQPLLLKAVVQYAQSNHKSTNERDGLILATAIIYSGIGLSKAAYNHFTGRLAMRTRGMLVAEISKKSLRLNYAEAKKEAIVTLMNSDITSVMESIQAIHHMWSYPLEIAVNMYILSTLVQEASVLVMFPAALSAISGYLIGIKLPRATEYWSEMIEKRVHRTSEMLQHIKAIKMIGLENIFTEYIQELRVDEMKRSKKSRFWLMLIFIVGTFCDCITKPLVLAGGLFWTTLGGDFTPTNVFTALASVSLIGLALELVITDYFRLQTARAAMKRLEAYLALPERHDPRQTVREDFRESTEKEKLGEQVFSVQPQDTIELPSCIIELAHAFIAVQGVADPVLKDVTLSIDRCDVVLVIGPTGSGKSTLLKSILGEINLISGSLYVESGNTAYCDQVPWIWNASIKDNIIGNSPVDMTWYHTVLTACLLKRDLEQLPNGDETITGSNGGNLSGGQKQRVALARALFARAAFTVLDDILSSLDRQTAAQIIENLFGENGILKRSSSTVIMATHSLQFLDIADRVLIVDAQGQVTMETDAQNVLQNEDVKDIIDAIQKNSIQSDQGEYVADKLVAPVPVAEEADLRRQRGDPTIYRFYARSFKGLELIIWLVLNFLTTFAEVFSDAYVRIWMEVDPNNKMFFVGYALIASSCAAIQAGSLQLWFYRLVPYSGTLLHRMLLEVVMRSHLYYLTGTDHGSFINRFSSDMSLVVQQLPLAALRAFYYCFRLVMRVGVIIAVTKYTIISVPVAVAAIYVIQVVYLRTSRQLRHLDLEIKAPLCAMFVESAIGLQHIRAFGWERQNIETTYKLIDDSQRPHYQMLAGRRWLGLVIDSLSLMTAVVLVTISVWLEYITSASGIGLSMVSIISLSFDATSFVEEWVGLESSLGALSRLQDLIRFAPLEEDPDDRARLDKDWPESGHIVMKDVCAKYDPNSTAPPILNNVSVDIPAQSKVGILGRTGSGKSSILMALLGFMNYTGTITIDGVDISKVRREKLRNVVTTIAQDNLHFDGTVRENLYPWAKFSGRREDQLNPLAVNGLLARLGLLSLLGENGERLDWKMSRLGLSYGQKQLMGIARSCFRHLSNNTRIIIMDEATSSLDHATEAMVLQIFKELFYDCTVLTVAHRTETLKGSTMMLHVADGNVSVDNNPEFPHETTGEATSNAAQSMAAEVLPSPSEPAEPSAIPPAAPEQTEPFVLPKRLISRAEFKKLSENATKEQILQLAALVDLGSPDAPFYNPPPVKLPKHTPKPGTPKWHPSTAAGPSELRTPDDIAQEERWAARLSTSSTRSARSAAADAGPSSTIPQRTSPQANPGSPRLSTSSNRSARHPAAEAGGSNASSPRNSSQSFPRVTGPYAPENLHVLYPFGHAARSAAGLPQSVPVETNEDAEHPRPTGPVPMNPIFNFWLQQSEASRLRNEEIIANGKLVERARERMERTRRQFKWEDAQEAKKKAKAKAKEDAKQVKVEAKQAKAEAKQAGKERQKRAPTETGESSAAGARKAESQPKATPVHTEAGESSSIEKGR